MVGVSTTLGNCICCILGLKISVYEPRLSNYEVGLQAIAIGFHLENPPCVSNGG